VTTPQVLLHISADIAFVTAFSVPYVAHSHSTSDTPYIPGWHNKVSVQSSVGSQAHRDHKAI
jgi:hypothetical protein